MASRRRHRHKGRTRLCGRREDPIDVRLSKTLAYALRHGANELQLDMTPSGFVSLSQLLALPLFQSFSEHHVDTIVRTDAKQRFTLTPSEPGGVRWIRANQGHTLHKVQDDELLVPLEAPTAVRTCVHGTYFNLWDSIWTSGLSRMQRNHIHFAEKEVTDDHVVSGMRASCNLFVYVDFAMAVNDGIKFYKSSNNVVLSPGSGTTGVIDKRYFVRAVKRDGTVVYEREREKRDVT